MIFRMTPAAMMVLLGLAGCAQPSGPVFGEWQGHTPGRNVNFGKDVDLVLDGAAGAQSGDYRLTTTEVDPFAPSGADRQWGGTWERSQRVFNGRPLTIIILKDPLPEDIGRYELASDGTLHALNPDLTPNMTKDGNLYTLSPVHPRHAG